MKLYLAGRGKYQAYVAADDQTGAITAAQKALGIDCVPFEATEIKVEGYTIEVKAGDKGGKGRSTRESGEAKQGSGRGKADNGDNGQISAIE